MPQTRETGIRPVAGRVLGARQTPADGALRAMRTAKAKHLNPPKISSAMSSARHGRWAKFLDWIRASRPSTAHARATAVATCPETCAMVQSCVQAGATRAPPTRGPHAPDNQIPTKRCDSLVRPTECRRLRLVIVSIRRSPDLS